MQMMNFCELQYSVHCVVQYVGTEAPELQLNYTILLPSLTLFGLEMQKISVNISVIEAHIEVVV